MSLTASKKLEAVIAAYLRADSFPVGTFIANAGNDTLTFAGPHGLTPGDPVRAVSTGALPANLPPGVTVFVKAVPTKSSLQLSAVVGGAVLDLGDVGAGVHTLSLFGALNVATIYEGFSVGQRDEPFHIVVEAGPEGGPLFRLQKYDVNVDLHVYRTAELEQPAIIEQHCTPAEILAWVFQWERNELNVAALEALDPTLKVSGYWPNPRRDEGSDIDFVTVLPLSFHVCHG